MSAEPDPSLERAYRYRAGWKVMGCLVLMCGGIGAGGTALLPVGCEKIRNGEMVLGVLIVAGCMLAIPMLLMAAFHAYVLYSVYGGYKACTRIPKVDKNTPPPPPLMATPV